MNQKLAELEKEALTDLHEQRLKNIEEIETLPRGMDKGEFLEKVATFSKYNKYFVLTKEGTEKLASKRTFVINKGRVTASKLIAHPIHWGTSDEDKEKFNNSVEDALAITQRELQIEFAKNIDEYLDNNPSIKLANSFFIDMDTLRWSTVTTFNEEHGDTVLSCNFLIRFNMYVD